MQCAWLRVQKTGFHLPGLHEYVLLLLPFNHNTVRRTQLIKKGHNFSDDQCPFATIMVSGHIVNNKNNMGFKEILTFGYRLHTTHCREFHYLKLCRPVYFVRTNQFIGGTDPAYSALIYFSN